MLKLLNRRLKRLYFRIRWPVRRRRSEPKIVIQKLRKLTSKSSSSQTETKKEPTSVNGSPAAVHPKGEIGHFLPGKPIRVATFNAALFSMAPVVPKPEKGSSFDYENEDFSKVRRSMSELNHSRPKSILKQSPLHSSSGKTTENLTKQQKFAKSKLRVSINLPDNEISLLRSRRMSFKDDENDDGSLTRTRARVSSRSNLGDIYGRSSRTIVEVLKEVDADILALQDVRAEEEKEMKPLSELADALGMNYVFAESWAPEYGNAVLSKWPIKRWKVQKIFDDTDFRNVLKTTIEVPEAGEVNFHCTHLDHLDENWRMKQINAIIRANDECPHILIGGLNSLDETDYSSERWTDIVKYYEEMGKPTPKVEVMKFLTSKEYTDAKDFAGECEPVVMIAKGQSVQGTCKYGTRVDYIMASPNSPYKFVPGSYSVFSSKGTSDHHIVKVDITKVESNANGDKREKEESVARKQRQLRHRVVKITSSSPSKGIWKTNNQER